MNGFRRMALDHYGPVVQGPADDLKYQPVAVTNTYQVGVRTFQTNALIEYQKKKASRFKWGHLARVPGGESSDCGDVGSEHDLETESDQNSEAEGTSDKEFF